MQSFLFLFLWLAVILHSFGDNSFPHTSVDTSPNPGFPRRLVQPHWETNGFPQSISKRRPQNYAECLAKGNSILRGLDAGCHLESIYEDPDTITQGDYPWIDSDYYYKNLQVLGLLTMSARMGGLDNDDFKYYGYEYWQDVWLPDEIWPARYAMLINTEIGLVIVLECYHPYVPLTNPTLAIPDPLPVNMFSDFLYLMYKKACNSKDSCMEDFQGICFSNIHGTVTPAVIHEAVGGEENLKVFPGQKFTMAQEQGRAIMGSSSGYGVLFSLYQHEVWGDKHIDAVNVFKDDNGHVCMFVRLEDDDDDDDDDD